VIHLEEKCRNEVINLHLFFEQWFKAEVENSEEVYSRLVNVLSDEFMLIMPTGQVSTREELLTQLHSRYGSHKNDEIPYSIWVKNIEGRLEENNLCLVTYEEWGKVQGKITARLSSALFRKKEGTPFGVEWIHVHEVFIPNE